MRGGTAFWMLAFLVAEVWFAVWVFAGEPYQKFNKGKCALCGTTGTWRNKLNVHHNLPQHVRPDLANVETNCITLCRECHWVVGHRRNWTNVVPTTIDAVRLLGGEP